MGRTNRTYLQLIDAEYRRLAPFRRALRQEEQVCFDALFRHAKRHRPAGVLQAAALPMESILLAILLEHERMFRALKQELAQLAQALPATPQETATPDGDDGLAL